MVGESALSTVWCNRRSPSALMTLRCGCGNPIVLLVQVIRNFDIYSYQVRRQANLPITGRPRLQQQALLRLDLIRPFPGSFQIASVPPA